jgi:hypothetical protein
VILNAQKEMIFNSKILKFDYGYEYFDNKLMGSISVKATDNGFEFTLNGLEEKYRGLWTGKELKKMAGNMGYVSGLARSMFAGSSFFMSFGIGRQKRSFYSAPNT